MGNHDSVPINTTHVIKKKIKPGLKDTNSKSINKKREDHEYQEYLEYKKSQNNDNRNTNNSNNRANNNNRGNKNNDRHNNYVVVENNREKQNDLLETKIMYDRMILDKTENRSSTNNSLISRNLNNIFEENNNNNNKNSAGSVNKIISYPTTSNIVPKPNLDNIEFTPYNYNDEVNKFKKSMSDEQIEFEEQELSRRRNFENRKEEKISYLKQMTKKFEEKYNPWKILEMQENDLSIANIKKSYKKMALKYHPDRAGEKYNEIFQIITQSYIYLLSKAEENGEIEAKINRKVEKSIYEDNINEGVENIYIDKDKFDINTFNKIFEEYKIPDAFDTGYGDLMKNGGGGSGEAQNSIENDCIFGKKFNNDIFNSHFDKEKNSKNSLQKNNQLMEYQDPNAGDSSSKFNAGQLGLNKVDDFGYSNNNNLSYTDYKTAHFDENLLIDVSKVNYKTYNSIDHLENERSKLSHQATPEDKRRYEMLDRKKQEDDKVRFEQLRMQDEIARERFNQLNQRLIVNKK
jgi:hypothetical protein